METAPSSSISHLFRCDQDQTLFQICLISSGQIIPSSMSHTKPSTNLSKPKNRSLTSHRWTKQGNCNLKNPQSSMLHQLLTSAFNFLNNDLQLCCPLQRLILPNNVTHPLIQTRTQASFPKLANQSDHQDVGPCIPPGKLDVLVRLLTFQEFYSYLVLLKKSLGLKSEYWNSIVEEHLRPVWVNKSS